MASRQFLSFALAGLLAGFALPALAAPQDDPWPGLVSDIFHDHKMVQDAQVIRLEAPERAEDAGLVPMVLHLGVPAGQKLTKVTLVIDGNPAPLAAVFELGPKAGITMIETRVRVDQYTNVHAVAEASDGQLYVSTAYVKAAGGCSAPAPKNEAEAHVGDMRLRALQPPQTGDAARREAMLMIRHPNNSGMQMDQLTHYYIPALYVNLVKITQGGEPILTVDGNISLSTDPNFRFDYVSNGAQTIKVETTDSSGAKFVKEWPAAQAM